MPRKPKAKPGSKTVRVNYGLFGRPNNSQIEKAINRWMKEGYRLVERDDQPSGCLTWHTGWTELTFVLDER